MMKKIILFSLASVICSAVNTKVNVMDSWQTIITCDDNLHRPGFKVILSENASWEQFHKQQRDQHKLLNIGYFITNNYGQEDFSPELLTATTKLYAKAIIQQEELAPRHYTKPEDQERYQNFINDLRDQL